MKEACSRVGLLSIKGQHMASHAQVHASTPRVGMVDSVDGKIDAVRVFIGGGIHAHTSFDFHSHLQGILLRLSSQGG